MRRHRLQRIDLHSHNPASQGRQLVLVVNNRFAGLTICREAVPSPSPLEHT